MKKKVTKKTKENGCCYNCKFAYLMQSAPYNPIVSECTLRKNRELAITHMCTTNDFEPNTNEIEIHPMIKLKR